MAGYWFICSDVHLRYGGAEPKRPSFYKFLESAEEGDTILLLGDILDFWVRKRNHEKFVANWESLYDKFEKLSKRKVGIHLCPR